MTPLMLLLTWVLLAFALAPLIGWLLRQREKDMRLRCDHCSEVRPLGGPGNILQHIRTEHPTSATAEYLTALREDIKHWGAS